MDALVKAIWVDALRSGKYKQADDYLKRRLPDGSFGYCCLGVLCDVVKPEDWGVQHTHANDHLMKHEEDELLSDETLDDLNIPTPIQNALAEMNDRGTPFAAIADYIEAKL